MLGAGLPESGAPDMLDIDGIVGEGVDAPGAIGVALGFPFVLISEGELGVDGSNDGTPAGEILGLIGVLVAGVDVCIPVENDPAVGGGKNADALGCAGVGAGALSMPRSWVFCSAVPE